MPSINENLNTWESYHWSDGGHEWSGLWGCSSQMWYGSILPRIHHYLPAKTILEIAPGFGRCTHFLHPLATKKMFIVDLTPRCIEACKERFKQSNHIEYILNDGSSLESVPDHSIDFVFSWDSLVHCDLSVVRKYIEQIKRKLSPDGVAFLHHSNMAAIDESLWEQCKGWRGQDVSAETVRDIINDSELHCISQELVNWSSGDIKMDCFSLFCLNSGTFAGTETQVVETDLIDEAAKQKRLSMQNNVQIRQAIETSFDEKISDFQLAQLKDRPIAVIGAGEYFTANRPKLPDNITYLCDNNKNLHGKHVCGIEVTAPSTLQAADKGLFVIVMSPKYHLNIYRQLNQLGLTFIEQFYYFSDIELERYGRLTRR